MTQLHDKTDNTPACEVSIIVPTYQEADALGPLIERIGAVRDGGLDLEVIIVDDNSQDGTEELIASIGLPWVRLITRTEDRGLSSAVLCGLAEANGRVLVVMDADLSHPPEVIPDFIAALDGGADFVVGSRYVPGGSTEDGWGVLRWINSKIATWMARPFTTVRDPMSGFLGFRRETWASAVDLDPVGYKIGLELIVKCRCRHVTEVPIHFSTRRHGESKLSLRVQLQYLTHIVRLARWKFPGWSSFVPFAVVGLSGVAVYAFLLWLLQAWLGERVSEDLQIIIAIAITMVWNFIFDRWLAFWYARKQSIVRQFVGFLAVCSIPVIVNFFVTRWLIGDEIVTPAAGVIGALVGSAAGVIFNWVVVRAIVFRAQARAGGD
ncbi:MAG: glycosyltransferase family 2 protein [Phycisphaerales bacterium]|nr:glycosyltransferase family 2 protein [Phycisphaerales bacterium]MDP7088105.1 glycosyltransferase family 2 protein [Phycisphaerales bacterium]MDP7189286.1 glycosyltransferase family 2 protein [Phycisphaerales bacterium]MDP7519248.1 glycosyltransferase family 2 protein [Phycisphaerales bacterium]HJN80322.1 glycosyltransferase family 2 protein [Phycisphaerales bacterium]